MHSSSVRAWLSAAGVTLRGDRMYEFADRLNECGTFLVYSDFRGVPAYQL